MATPTTSEGTLAITPRYGEDNPKGGFCGRPTTSRGPCRMPRRIVYACSWWDRLRPDSRNDMQWEIGGCKRHLTAAEEVFVTIAERLGETEQIILDYTRTESVRALFAGDADKVKAPDCWAWFEVDQLARKRGYNVPIPTDLAELEAWHQGKCAICGHHEALVFDHDHWSGFVRGLLCYRCNTNEDRHSGGTFALYRQRHPALIFGLLIPYTPGIRPEDPGQRFKRLREQQNTTDVGAVS